MKGPGYSCCQGHYAGHAEAEEEAGKEEFEADLSVDLEDSHVHGGQGQEYDQENGTYWDIDRSGGLATQLGLMWEVGWSVWFRLELFVMGQR